MHNTVLLYERNSVVRGLRTLACVFGALPPFLLHLFYSNTHVLFSLFFFTRQVKDGVRLFEISDVVLRDDSCDTGARNCRRLVATYMGPTAGFEIIHGLVDRIMSLVQVGGGPARHV